VGLGIKKEKTCSKPDYLNQDVIEGKAIAGVAEWLVRWAPRSPVGSCAEIFPSGEGVLLMPIPYLS
jgi:hypothetical protein